MEEKYVCTKNFQPARLSQMLLFRKENKTKKADKAKKDPDKPKRPLSAYFIWMTEVKRFSNMFYFNISFGRIVNPSSRKWEPKTLKQSPKLRAKSGTV